MVQTPFIIFYKVTKDNNYLILNFGADIKVIGIFSEGTFLNVKTAVAIKPLADGNVYKKRSKRRNSNRRVDYT